MPAPGNEATTTAVRPSAQTAAKLLVRCLENEGVEYIFLQHPLM